MRYQIKQILGEGRLWLCNHFINKIPSHHIRLYFYRSIMKFDIGEKSYIHLGCRFNCKNLFKMGRGSVINQYCHLDNRGGIIIGDNVSIAPQSKLITADHDLYHLNCIGRSAEILIEDYCFVGYGATILAPSLMKNGSVIGANSLLKGVTEAYYLYVGNPCIKKKIRPQTLNYTMDYDRLFN